MDVALVLAAGEYLLSPTMVMVLLLRGTASEKNDVHELTTRNTTKYETDPYKFNTSGKIEYTQM